METVLWLWLVTFSQFTSILAQSDTYIIQMDLTAMPKAFSDHRSWYDTVLSSISDNSQVSILAATTTTSSNLLYAYENTIHGFSARLSPSELKAIKNSPGFISAILDVKVTVDTSHSFEFLGLNNVSGAWPTSNYGNDIIIGLVDTGVWPESESYNDDGMSEVPLRWKGECETGTDFNSSMCNKKLIGARYFNKGLVAKHPNVTIVMNSTRDTDGHGTHTSSTAGGNYVEGASYFGYAEGTTRGMAPRARVAMYKALWEAGACTSDIIAAIDQAISDGVDVLSLSLGLDGFPMHQDPVAIATFAAMEKGIFVSTSAGNEGPWYELLHNGIPWVLTVGAGTIDREYYGVARLGNGNSVVGISLYPGKSISTPVPLQFMDTCTDTTEIKKVGHKIVVCIDMDDSVGEQVHNVLNGKVAGGLFISNSTSLSFYTQTSFPAIFLSLQDGQILRDYIDKSHDPRVSFEFQKTSLGTKPAPSVAHYSSRGPSRSCPSVLKPDLIAPGTLVLASWPPVTPVTDLNSHSIYSNFNLETGTSMSCPHAAGLAALLKGIHPEWSPAAIRSAMMTTSDALDNTLAPIKDIGDSYHIATPLAMGAGHVNPNKALDPGLIYDANAEDYVRVLCSMNYTRKQIQAITRTSSYNCSSASLDLNYPSFIAFFDRNGTSSSTIQEFRRTVTNIGDGVSTYTAMLTPMDGLKVHVVPNTLAFTKKYQKLSYALVVESLGKMKEVVVHGSLIWVDVGQKHVVRSPIVATSLGTQPLS